METSEDHEASWTMYLCRFSAGLRSIVVPLGFKPCALAMTSVRQLGAVDATVMTNLAQKYGIQGYPTIKVFPPGPKRRPQDYNGPREAAGIVDYATQVSEWVMFGFPKVSIHVGIFLERVGTDGVPFSSV